MYMFLKSLNITELHYQISRTKRMTKMDVKLNLLINIFFILSIDVSVVTFLIYVNT